MEARDDILIRPIYQIQPREPANQFGCFCVYRDLPHGAYDPTLQRHLAPAPRSLSYAAEVFGANYRTVESWSSAWHWVRRARAYDAYLEEQERAVRLERRKILAEKMEDWNFDYRMDAAEMYEQLKGRVQQMMAFPIADEDRSEVYDEEGNPTGEVVIMKPVGWNHNTLLRMIGELRNIAIFATGTDQAGILDRYIEQIDIGALSEEAKQAILDGEDPFKVIIRSLSAQSTDQGGAEPERAETGT